MSKYISNFSINSDILLLSTSIMERVGILTRGGSLTAIKDASKKKVFPKDPLDINEFLGSSKKEEKITPTTSPLLKKVFAWIKKSEDTVHPLLSSAIFFYSLLLLGPNKEKGLDKALLFAQGQLSSYRKIFAYLDFDSIIANDPEGLKKAILDCEAKKDCNPIIVFYLTAIEKSLIKANQSLKEEVKQPSELEKKLLSVMEEQIYYPAKELLAKLGLKSRVALKRNYLEPAMKDGLIEMSLPSKKNSPLQRYRKK